MFDLLVGLYQCSDYKSGSHLLKSEDDTARVEFIQTVFEVYIPYLQLCFAHS